MPRHSFLIRLARRVAREVADARLFGSGIGKYHWCRLARRPECTLRLAGSIPVTIRPGETDLASFHRIFDGLEYEIPVPSARAAVRTRHDAIAESGRVPVIVDAGAYVGASSLWFASKYPRSHIVAIEPDPDSCRILERNLAGLKQYTVIEAAVGATPGHVRLIPAPESWATQVERADSGTRTVTMNEAFAVASKGEPFAAKINIEGFEQEVFSGNLEWLDRIALLFIEPHDWLLPERHTSRSFQKALGDREFHLFIAGQHLCYVRLRPPSA